MRDGQVSGTSGEFIGKFERGFSAYSDCSQGVAVSNGTVALHLGVVALGIGPGDEVIVATFTNMATFFAVIYAGARPVPVDIEPDTWNVDPALIERRITPKTRAIMVVHIYGHPCDMDPILEVARKHNLRVIEDCAEAHGATYRGRKVGSLGDVGAFSFYANKVITTGEGGMLTTKDGALADKMRSLRSLAFGRRLRFMHEDIGYNYRLTNLQAAIGLAQLTRIESIISAKRRLAERYRKRLSEVKGLQLPIEKDYARNIYWMYHLVVHSEKFGSSKDALVSSLSSAGIETRDSFIPYNDQEIFIRRGWTDGNKCPVASFVGKNGFYLPSSPELTDRQLDYIAAKVTGSRR